MATLHEINGTQSGQLIIADQDTVLIGISGILNGLPAGIFSDAAGSNEIVVNGQVNGIDYINVNNGWGIRLGGYDARHQDHISITASGKVSGTFIGIELADSGVVDNHGTVLANKFGILADRSLTLTNAGSISVNFVGVESRGTLKLTNSGTIHGNQWGVKGSVENDYIRNTGRIEGGDEAISLGLGHDVYDGRGGGILVGKLDLHAGNDSAYGGVGSEWFVGGLGNDFIDGGAGDDTIDGGDDIDTVSYSGTAAAYVNLMLTGAQNTKGYGIDTLINIENLVGGTGRDTFVGNDAANMLKGGSGNDTLYGGLGNDVLTGGSGKDVFVFNTAPNGSTNKDRIDFSVRDDTIRVENAIFKALKNTGTLNSSSFVLGSKAKDGNDHFGYNKTTGDLWYDPNGNKAGGQVVIANLGKNKLLTNYDLVVI